MREVSYAALPNPGVPAVVARNGSWIGGWAMATSTAGPSTGTLRVNPILIPRGITVSRFAGEASTGVSTAVLRCGIYNDSGYGTPGTLFSEFGTLDGGTTAVVGAALTANLVIPPGLYWIGGCNQVAAATWRASQICPGTLVPIDDTGGVPTTVTMGGSSWQTTGVTGSLPVAPSWAIQNGACPRVMLFLVATANLQGV